MLYYYLLLFACWIIHYILDVYLLLFACCFIIFHSCQGSGIASRPASLKWLGRYETGGKKRWFGVREAWTWYPCQYGAAESIHGSSTYSIKGVTFKSDLSHGHCKQEQFVTNNPIIPKRHLLCLVYWMRLVRIFLWMGTQCLKHKRVKFCGLHKIDLFLHWSLNSFA